MFHFVQERKTQVNNHKCTLTWNTHCNKEEIEGIKKEVYKCIKLKFWNVTNLELNYRKEVYDNRKKT